MSKTLLVKIQGDGVVCNGVNEYLASVKEVSRIGCSMEVFGSLSFLGELHPALIEEPITHTEKGRGPLKTLPIHTPLNEGDIAGLMYWVNRPNIGRAAMDGSNQTTIIRNLISPYAITIDYTENRLYYSDYDTIYSSDMLGNNIQLVKPGDGKNVEGISADADYIYWTHYWTACSSSNGGCRELCLAHPGGRTCACRDSWELQEDGLSCCPSGYTAYRGACFKAYNQDKTYSQAREVCAADGALLAMPKDRDVDNFVRELKNAVNKISHFWFGLNDGNSEGEWVWEDGTPHDISTDWNLWQPGEPNGNEGENCANYYGSEWNDAPCSSAYKFICQLNEAISCSLGHFRCGNGLACILSWKRCDGIADCTDGSDEEGCVCKPIPEDFEIDSRSTMLPNQLGQTTFEEIQNSSVVELLNSSYSIAGKYHPEMRTFISTVIFPQCNVSEENKTRCSSSPNAGNMTSCMGTQLVPCRSWCEEVLNTADDWIKNQLPRCSLFPSSDHNCWNPNSAKKGSEVCYHGVGINYRGTWSKTTSGADCVEWSAPQAGYYKTEFPWANLDNNYCRNPTGLERPFCLTEDGSQEECDVIPCDAEGCWDRGPPNYGKRTPTKRFYYVGEKVTYSCNEGYTIKSGYTKEVRCIGGGNWQYDKPSCSVNHRQRLQEDLLEISSKSLPPENVIINFTGSVVQLVDLTWQDSRLSWDPKYYDNVTTLSVHGNDIWTPTLTLKRNDDIPSKSSKTDVIARSTSTSRQPEALRTKVATTLKVSKPPASNITREERTALKDLATNQDIVILPADKGRCTVVLDREQYDKKNPANKFKGKISTALKKLQTEGVLDRATYLKLNRTTEQPPAFYGLPKIHKVFLYDPQSPEAVSVVREALEADDTLADRTNLSVDQIKKRVAADFFDHINQIDDNIKFTQEPSHDNMLPFLDTKTIEEENGNLRFEVYRKPVHTDQNLAFDSHHPLEHKLAVIKTLFLRADNIITSDQAKTDEHRHLRGAVAKCGYQNWTFNKALKPSDQSKKTQKCRTIDQQKQVRGEGNYRETKGFLNHLWIPTPTNHFPGHQRTELQSRQV
ncbi:hypothetical protein Bbelb_038910 [Branchiostoma belcheri]|nr:hypothetical protein Bbelb_038910 [Branchiostoma belcheri]